MAVNKVVFGDETLVDLTETSVTPETLAAGETALDKSGERITGTLDTTDFQPKDFIVNITWGDDNTITADKTYAEITAALDEGRSVYLKDGSWVVPYTSRADDSVQFGATYHGEGVAYSEYQLYQDTGWEYYNNTAQPRDFVIQVTWNNETGEYEVDTTFEEIWNAYRGGMNCVCLVAYSAEDCEYFYRYMLQSIWRGTIDGEDAGDATFSQVYGYRKVYSDSIVIFLDGTVEYYNISGYIEDYDLDLYQYSFPKIPDDGSEVSIVSQEIYDYLYSCFYNGRKIAFRFYTKKSFYECNATLVQCTTGFLITILAGEDKYVFTATTDYTITAKRIL